MPEEKGIIMQDTARPRKRLRRRRRERHQAQAYERVMLIGNPNVGKSVIFGLLTGKYVTVSNFPGTTVEVLYGNIRVKDKRFLLIDCPGANTLTPMSEDEKVTRDMLLREKPFSVVLVGDAKNLKRALLLYIQLAEMELPVVLNLNMEDEAKDRGIEIDYNRLSTILNIDVVCTVAPQKKGIHKLQDALITQRYPSLTTHYGEEIEQAVNKITDLLPEAHISKRSIALMILSGDETIRDWLITNVRPDIIRKLEDIRDEAQSQSKEDFVQTINQKRIRIAEEINNEVQKKSTEQVGKFAQKLSAWTMHPVLGIPFLFGVLFAFYMLVGKVGAGILVDLLEKVIFMKYLNPVIETTVKSVIPIAFFQEMLIGHYGIFTMGLTYAIGIILPITATFFFVFGLLEDSGYLPRLSVITDKAFRFLGLNGKVVLPLVLGLGCCTMATMTTRILETKRERIIATFLIALTIPCSAQIGVILGILGSYPVRAVLWWAGSLIMVLIFSGYLSSKVLPGEKPDLFIELPPMRMPSLKNIVLKTLSRIEWYLKEAVPLFLLGAVVLFFLDKFVILSWIQNASSPVVVKVLGLPAKTTEAFLMGFLRRDYGAAGIFDMARQGFLNENQMIVGLVTMTLFVPCVANLFMMIKERGLKTALFMIVLIIPFAVLVGGVLRFVLSAVT
jgi:ferrous iron transport protein B